MGAVEVASDDDAQPRTRRAAYMLIVIICLAFMYIWPGMTLWLPEFLYGK